MRIAERRLLMDHRSMRMYDVLALRQIVQIYHAGIEPRGVWMLGGKPRLDLLVIHDSPFGGVNEEHATRLEPALGHDTGGIHVHHTSFARHDDAIIVGHPETARAETVAIQHRANDRPICEGNRGRSVPGFHLRSVETIE